MDRVDEVVVIGPPGWRVTEIIRRWPVEIEIISCLVEKEENGEMKTAIRTLLKCQGEPVKLMVRAESDKDRLLYEETLAAGYIFSHIARATLMAAEQVVMEATQNVALGDGEWKEDWIEKVVKEAREDVRYRLGRAKGGRRSKGEIVPAMLEVYYGYFLPFIQEARKAVKKAGPDWQAKVRDVWGASGFPELPLSTLDDMRTMSASDFALEMAARYATSGAFHRSSGFSIQVLKNVRTKFTKRWEALGRAIEGPEKQK